MNRKLYCLIFTLVAITIQNSFGQDYYNVNMPSYWIPTLTSYVEKGFKIKNIKVNYINNVIELTDKRINPIYGFIELADGTKQVILKSDSLKAKKLKNYELLTTELIRIDTTFKHWLRYHDGVPWVDYVCCFSHACKDYWGMEKTHFYVEDYINIYQPISQQTQNPINSKKQQTLSSSEIMVYPNPTKDKVIVLADHIEQIQVYDTKGSLIKTITPNPKQTETTVNLNFLPTGIYILKIRDTQKQITTSRIVKE